MTSGDVIAVVAVSVTVFTFIIGWVITRFSNKERKIELLETKNNLLEKTNHKLELQNLELRVTGVALNKLLRQLPSAEEADEEKE